MEQPVERGHVCVYMWFTEPHKHPAKAPTTHTKSALTLLLKLDIRLSEMKNLQEKTDFFFKLSQK